jgi:hypothetical protein
MELDQLHENWTGKNGESPEGRQMKPNDCPFFKDFLVSCFRNTLKNIDMFW